MRTRSFLVVDVNDDLASADQVRAGIEKAGGAVESVEASRARRGTPELCFILSAVEGEVVGSIVTALSRMPGVAVRSISRHQAPAFPGTEGGG